MIGKLASALLAPIKVKKIYLGDSRSPALTIEDGSVYLGDSRCSIIEIKGSSIYSANIQSAILKVKADFVHAHNCNSAILELVGNSVYPVNGQLAILKARATYIYEPDGSALKKVKQFHLYMYKNSGDKVLYKTSDKLNNIELIAALYQLGEIPIDT
jgi:hypothetical protein